MRGTNASSPSSRATGKATSSSAHTTRVGTVDGHRVCGKFDAHYRLIARRRRSQRRCSIVVAPSAKAVRPECTVLIADRIRQPSAAYPTLVGSAHAGEKWPQSSEVVLRKERLGVWPAQKVHVGTRALLRDTGLQIAQERCRVRRVDHDQPLQLFRSLGADVPCHRPSPVVRNESLDAASSLLVNQCNDVRDEMLGSIGLDLVRRTRSFEAAKVGGDAAIAVTEPLEHVIPDERTFREPVKKKQYGKRTRTSGPTAQGDAVWQSRVKCLNHASSWLPISPSRRLRRPDQPIDAERPPLRQRHPA
jgi:hypothetical protein